MPSGPVHLIYGILLAVTTYPHNPTLGGVVVYSSLAPDFATAAYHDRYPNLRYVDYAWAHDPSHVLDYAELISKVTVSPELHLPEKEAVYAAEIGISSHLFLDVFTHVRTYPLSKWREEAGITTVLYGFYRPWDPMIPGFVRWALGRAAEELGSVDAFWRYAEEACSVAEELMGGYVYGAYVENLSREYFGDPHMHLIDWLRRLAEEYGIEPNDSDAYEVEGIVIPALQYDLLRWMHEFDPGVKPEVVPPGLKPPSPYRAAEGGEISRDTPTPGEKDGGGASGIPLPVPLIPVPPVGRRGR